MALKCIIDSPVEVPGPLREFYAPMLDGKFALVLDGEPAGYVKTDKLSEFRDNNRALNARKTELERQLAAFEGIDPNEHVAMRERLATFEGMEPAALASKHAADLARALETAKAELTAEHATELAAERAAHAESEFKHLVSNEFLRAGGRASAVDYMLGIAAKTFAMKDGKVSTSEFSAVNPGQPLTVAEWMQAQTGVHDFAFLPSRGGGAGTSRNSASVTVPRRTVSCDPVEFGHNLAAIAGGEVDVQ